MEIRPASSPDDLDRARELFSEYAASLPFDLSFQVFDRELAGLREPAELATLSAEERRECEVLWAEVDNAIRRAPTPSK